MRRVGTVFWNGSERRVRALWRLVVFPAVVIGGSLGLRKTLLAAGMPPQGPFGLMTFGLGLASIVLLATWLSGWLLDRRPFASFGLAPSGAWFLDFGFGLGLGAALMAGVFATEWSVGWLVIRDGFESTSPAGFAVSLTAAVVLFVCVGFYEELVTRGYLLRNLAEGLAFARIGPRGGLIVATALSSGFFGLAHADNPNATLVSTINVSLAGVLLALGLLLTGRLALPIGLHITWNLFQGAVFGFPVSGNRGFGARVLVIEQTGPVAWTGGPFGPEGGLLGLAAMIVATALILAWVRWRYGQVALCAELARPPGVRSRDLGFEPRQIPID